MSRHHLKNKPKPPKPQARVVIGYCHPAEISAFFHSSLIGLLDREHGRVIRVAGILSGPKIDSARNDIVKAFLETDGTHLFMVDTDMVLGDDTLDRLLRHDKDIVGGLCFAGAHQNSPVVPTIRRIVEKEDGSPNIDVVWDYPLDSLVEVDATGAACILIKRKVLEDILAARGENHPLPWFAHGAHNGVIIGEDIAFCLLAKKLGFEVWCDTKMIIPHVKTRYITDKDYALSLTEEKHPAHSIRHDIPIFKDLVNGDHSS